MKRIVWNGLAVAVTVVIVWIAWLSVRIEQQSSLDEAHPADVILVLGAAEYRGTALARAPRAARSCPRTLSAAASRRAS